MKMNENMMIQELNDTQLDMVNGGGFFDTIKDLASGIRDVAKDLVTIVKTQNMIHSGY